MWDFGETVGCVPGLFWCVAMAKAFPRRTVQRAGVVKLIWRREIASLRESAISAVIVAGFCRPARRRAGGGAGRASRPRVRRVDSRTAHQGRDDEVYANMRDLAINERYALFRYLTHLADHAASNDDYRRELEEIDFSRLHPTVLALIRAIADDAPCLVEALHPMQAQSLLEAKPASPVIRLSTRPVNLRVYHRWGFVI